MTKFYTVMNDSNVGREYWRYVESERQIAKAFNEFAEEHDIKANSFYPSHNVLWIVPEEEDEEKFGNQFMLKDIGKFKKTSIIGKAWAKKCSDENIKYAHKPFIPFCFNYAGKSRSRLFDCDNVIYCTFECPIDVEAPDGFIEIKGSDFYAIMEKNNIKL